MERRRLRADERTAPATRATFSLPEVVEPEGSHVPLLVDDGERVIVRLDCGLRVIIGAESVSFRGVDSDDAPPVGAFVELDALQAPPRAQLPQQLVRVPRRILEPETRACVHECKRRRGGGGLAEAGRLT